MVASVTFRTLDGSEHRRSITSGRFSRGDDVGLDLRSLVALPGFTDAHGHLANDSLDDYLGAAPASSPVDRAFAQLRSGVFLVFDKGAASRGHLALLEEDPTRRPDLEMAGSIIHPPGGYYPGVSDRESEAADLVRVASEEAAGPARWVKLIGDWPRPGLGAIPNYEEEDLAAVVATAHEADCRVAIHTAAPGTPSMAVRAGVDSIEHGLFLTADDVEALGARGGAWVPTLLAMGSIRDSLRAGSSGQILFDDGIRNAASLLRDAVDAGVHVLAGTDLAVPHGRVAEEAVAMAEAGLGPALAVEALTTTGRTYAGLGDPWEDGAPADLVAVAGDPLGDPATLLDPVVVMRHGRLLVDHR
ncbi:MAG: amidohydrolase family protein [Acidimicrobiia bacterium]|nr:amidohydrolase family protein [Acidimicrobiia bacterium]